MWNLGALDYGELYFPSTKTLRSLSQVSSVRLQFSPEISKTVPVSTPRPLIQRVFEFALVIR